MPASLPVIDASETLCCAPLGSAAFSPERDAAQIAARLRAMADAGRVRILQELSCCDGHALTTTEVATLLEVTAATANHHLRQLERAGLVAPRRDGARVLYALRADNVRAVAAALSIGCDCC
ncbi:helix-turn-helix transcriptional regulator [Demequina sp. NBRC 110053]|uniref:ArsR/SmtB family transcription factor n=1 Tax=Demequina sp. NBRC 110053 TaxID=1570342 RepID=UPI000A05A601|nr:metalloregulator ArsR/SmtB family transcription factor [Demequina sp. NBRC 110053]